MPGTCTASGSWRQSQHSAGAQASSGDAGRDWHHVPPFLLPRADSIMIRTTGRARRFLRCIPSQLEVCSAFNVKFEHPTTVELLLRLW
jgi:hypothetical protein